MALQRCCNTKERPSPFYYASDGCGLASCACKRSDVSNGREEVSLQPSVFDTHLCTSMSIINTIAVPAERASPLDQRGAQQQRQCNGHGSAGGKATWPGVSVILPVKGCRKHSLKNWQSQLAMLYEGPIEFLFIVDDKVVFQCLSDACAKGLPLMTVKAFTGVTTG